MANSPRFSREPSSISWQDRCRHDASTPVVAQDVNDGSTVEMERDLSQAVRRNISSFRTLEWQPYFSNLNDGAILVDIDSRALHLLGPRTGITACIRRLCR